MPSKPSLDEVKKEIRSILQSQKGGVDIAFLQKDYKELIGSFIPHRAFGFSSLIDFIASLKDAARIQRGRDGEIMCYAVATEATAHIEKMIAAQRPGKKKKKKRPTFLQANISRFSSRSRPSSQALKFKFHNPSSSKSSFQASLRPITQQPYHQVYRNTSNNSRVVTTSGKSNNHTTKTSKTEPLQETVSRRVTVRIPGNPVTEQSKMRGSSKAFNKKPSFNPLMSDDSDSEKRNEPKKKNIVDVNSNESGLTKVIKERIQKLVSKTKAGILSTDLQEAYFEAYHVPLPSTIVLSLECSSIPDVVKIEKTKFGSAREKIIFKPLSEKTYVKYGIPKARKLPIGMLDEKVIVTHIESWDKIYVRKISDIEKVNRISPKDETVTVQSPIEIGDFVAFHKGKERCRVLRLNKNKDKAALLNVDTGAQLVEECKNLRCLPEHMSLLYSVAIRCSLFGPSGDNDWAAVEYIKLEEFLLDRSMKINVVSHSEVDSEIVHSVIFYDNKCNINNSIQQLVKGNTPVKSKSEPPSPVPVIKPLQQDNADEVSSSDSESVTTDYSTASTVSLTLSPEDEELLRVQPGVQADIPESCEVGIFSVESTLDVKACVMAPDYLEQLPHLENSMKEYYSTHKRGSVPLKVGKIYATCVDGGDSMYRARLLSVDSKGQCSVFLVDNAGTYTVNKKELRLLMEDFCKLPCQAVTLSLALLEHEVLSTHSDVLQFLTDNIVEKTCVAQVVARSTSALKPAPVVMLFDTSCEDEVNINKRCLYEIQNEELAPRLPENEEWINARISNIELDRQGAKIWLQIPGEGLTRLHEVEKTSNAPVQSRMMCKFSSVVADNLYIEKPCVCYVNTTKSLQRVEIRNITQDKMKAVSVFLPDYGTTKEIAKSNLKKVTDERMMTLPPQALCCKLSIIPESEIKTKVLDKNFATDLRGTDVKVQYLNAIENGLPSVALIITCDNEEVALTPPVFDPLNSGDFTRSFQEEEIRSITASSRSKSNSALSLEEAISQYSSVHSVQLNSSRHKLTRDNLLIHDLKPISPIRNDKNSFLSISEKNVPLLNSPQSPDKADESQLLHARNIGAIEYKKASVLGTLIGVKIGHIISPTEVYLVPLPAIKLFEELAEAMSSVYNKESTKNYRPSKIQEKFVYAAPCKVGNKMQWCRAEVSENLDDTSYVKFIDLGTTGKVKHCDFRMLKKEFCKKNRLAMQSSLCGVIPCNGANEWSADILNNMKSKLTGAIVYAHILSYKRTKKPVASSCAQVFLYDTSQKYDVCINEKLVEQRYADWDFNYQLQ